MKAGKKVRYGRSKLIVVGDGRAGETSVIKTFLCKSFDPAQASTTGVRLTCVNVHDWKGHKVVFLQSICVHSSRSLEHISCLRQVVPRMRQSIVVG